MRGRFFPSVVALALCSAAGVPTSAGQTAADQPIAPTASADSAQWQQELAAWRTEREKEISAPDGWLTLAGLEWLKPGINSIGSAADNRIRLPGTAPDHLGLLTIIGNNPKAGTRKAASAKANPRKAAPAKPGSPHTTVVELLAPAGGFPAELTIDGKPAQEGQLSVDDAKPSIVAWRGLSLVVLQRGDRYVLRIKDANSPDRAGFHGLNWYAPDPHYRVTARWIPFHPPQVEQIPTVIGTTLQLEAPGLAMFPLGGKILHLEPVLEDPSDKTLFFILRDPTSKTATYGGGRFLHTGLPDHGLDQPGNLTLDFNRLENPPCAYTNYATCPLPPEQNRLEIDLQAGEKRYK